MSSAKPSLCLLALFWLVMKIWFLHRKYVLSKTKLLLQCSLLVSEFCFSLLPKIFISMLPITAGVAKDKWHPGKQLWELVWGLLAAIKQMCVCMYVFLGSESRCCSVHLGRDLQTLCYLGLIPEFPFLSFPCFLDSAHIDLILCFRLNPNKFWGWFPLQF